MYKVLIADDEYYIKTGMRDIIPWQDFGFELAGEASDGEEALELAKRIQPDLVITDIRMPRMNGLELINSLKTCLPLSRIIVISGYNDFEYVQQAIKLSVCDYILKPVDRDELEQILKKIKDEFDMRNESNEQMERLKQQLHQSMPILKENFLQNWIGNRIGNPEEIRSNMVFYGLGNPEKSFLAVTICIDDLKGEQSVSVSEEKAQLLKLMLNNTCQSVFDARYPGKSIIFNDRYDNAVILLHSFDAENESFYNQDVFNLCSELRDILAVGLNRTITIGIGRIYDACNEVYLSYNESLDAIEDKFWLGKNQTIYYKDIQHTESFDIYQSLGERKQILDLLKLGDVKNTGRAIRDFFGKAKKLPLEYVRNISMELVLAAIRTLMENGINISDVMGKDASPVSVMENLETIDEVIGYLIYVFETNASYIFKTRSARKREVTYMALDYIEKNYSRDFGLDSMCECIGLSTHYFSSLFKKEMGENFLEYLTKYRINKAKELIKNPLLKTYDVAEKVGYTDARYFSQLFKKYVGCTPSEYREQTTGVHFSQ